MTYKDHIFAQLEIYALLVTWAVSGAFLPTWAAVVYCVLTYILILRTGNLTKILISFLSLLIFSDSRSEIFTFAETAKIAVVVITGVYLALNYKHLELRRNHLFRFFFPFLLFSVLATLWASQPFSAFQKSLSYGLIYFIIPLIILNARVENKWLELDVVYFLTSVLAVGLAIYIVSPEFVSLVGRFRGLLGNPNGLGLFLVVMFAVTYPIFKIEKVKEFVSQPFKWFFYGLFISSLILSGSRTALIAIVLFFLFNQIRYFTNVISVLLFFTLVVSYEYLLVHLPQLVVFLGVEDYFRLETLDEGSGRFVAWNFAWKHIQNDFFLGGGFTHNEYIFRSFGQRLSMLGHQGNVHNSYLTLWLDTGLIGIILLGFGIIMATLNGLKNYALTLPVVLSVLFSAYFESWLSASLNPFTSLFIISLTILSISPKEYGLANDH